MKQTKIGWLMAFLLFSGFLLRGQGWRRFYDNDSTSTTMFDAIPSKTGGYLLNVGTANGQPYGVIKTDFEGRVIRTISPKTVNHSGKLIELSDTTFIIVDNFATVTKYNMRGDSLWQRSISQIPYFYNFNFSLDVIKNGEDIIVLQNGRDSILYLSKIKTTDGQVIFNKPIANKHSAIKVFFDKTSMGYTCIIANGSSHSFIFQVDSVGNVIKTSPIGYPYFYGSIKQVENNNLLAIAQEEIFKIKPNGDTLWRINTYWQPIDILNRVLLSIDALLTKDSTAYIVVQDVSDRTGNRRGVVNLTKYGLNGNKIWSKYIIRNNWESFNYSHNIFQAPDGGFVVSFFGAYFTGPSTGRRSAQLIKTDSLGNVFTNSIRGVVVNDTNGNCRIDSTDAKNKYHGIEFRKGNDAFYAYTDRNGNYENSVDTGTYIVKAIPYNRLWESCTPAVTVSIPNFYTADSASFAIKTLANCPSLSVDIATYQPFRRCNLTDYSVKYCNYGTITAQNARIEIKLDSLLEYISATRPLSNRSGQTLIFNLGNVASLDCGSFQITARVKCGDSTRIGQSLCTEAHIFPDTICNPPANWSGANVVVNGRCDRDSVRFLIRNTSSVSTAPLRRIIIEDEIVFLNDNRSIAPNASQTIALPANGKTWRLNQDQEPNNPRNTVVSAVVEGCRVGTNTFSTGFVNDFPNNTGDPSVSISCAPIQGSYDPNEKLAFPEGFKNQHFIEQNTPIDYQIGFQNTGNDTAFTVILRDTLHESLDIATLKTGASSHAFTWDLVGKNVLVFTFNNINLVDSFKNERASHGFVKFRINQKKDVKLGTRIENQAAIYFDFNAPIFTNTTFHTVGKNIITVSIAPVFGEKTTVKVSPNPFSETATFELPPFPKESGFPSSTVKTGIFELFDLNGKVLRRETFDNQQFDFYRKDLPTGIFIFKITTLDGRLIGNGKIVAQ